MTTSPHSIDNAQIQMVKSKRREEGSAAGGHKRTSSTFLKGVLLLCRAGFGAPISCVHCAHLSAPEGSTP